MRSRDGARLYDMLDTGSAGGLASSRLLQGRCATSIRRQRSVKSRSEKVCDCRTRFVSSQRLFGEALDARRLAPDSVQPASGDRPVRVLVQVSKARAAREADAGQEACRCGFPPPGFRRPRTAACGRPQSSLEIVRKGLTGSYWRRPRRTGVSDAAASLSAGRVRCHGNWSRFPWRGR